MNAATASGAGGARCAPRAGACAGAAGAALALCALALALSSAPAAAAAECPNEAIRSAQGAAALPDCRAYEQVTPAAKGGGEPLGPLSSNSRVPQPTRGAGARAANDGERLAWLSEYALPERSLLRPYAPGVPGVQYLSRRSERGWSSENTIPPQSVQYGLACPNYVGIVAWSTDLHRGVLADGIAQESSLSPGGPFADESLECGHDEPLLDPAPAPGFEERHKDGSHEGSQNLFLRGEEGRSYRLLNPTPQGAPWPRRKPETKAGGRQEYFPASFLAGSDDLSHVVFEEELPLTADAEEIAPEVKEACAKQTEEERRACWEGHDNLYQWTEGAGGAGTVSLVTILPGGAAVEGRLAGATRNNGSAVLGGTPRSLLTPNVANFRHAVSADGSRVFFEAGGALYVREDATATVQIDAAQSGLAGASDGGGEFMAAGADGSWVLFSADASHLLTADTVPGSGANLYECELPQGTGGACELSNLTPAAEAGVLGVSGTNEGTAEEEESGSPYVYFVATGALVTPAPGAGPQPGRPNLYLRHGGATSFIATLEEGKEEAGEDANGLPCTRASVEATGQQCKIAAPPTYRAGDSCDWTARGGCAFRFDSSGATQDATGGLTARVSANGRFLAFNSVKPLTGYDNEDAAGGGKMDAQIFLYDAATGGLSCASCNPDPSVRPTAPASIREPAWVDDASYQNALYPQRNLTDAGQLFFESPDALLSADSNGVLDVYEYEAGRLHLISSGKGETESIFLDAGPGGRDVFFMTAQPLLGRDRDTAYDIYDARAGGGFPEANGPAPPCGGEAQCRAPAASAPAFPVPLSSLFHGPGNQRQAAAKRRRHRHKHKGRRPAREGTDRARRRGAPARNAAYLSGAPARGPAPSGAPAPATSASEEPPAPVEVEGPYAVTGEATAIGTEAPPGTTSAELHGVVFFEATVNSPKCIGLIFCKGSAGTEITDCWFEYATAEYHESNGGYDKRADCEPPPPYSGQLQVSVAARLGLEPDAALEPGTTYHYRLVAEDKLGEVGEGADRTFETEGFFGAPTIDAESYRISHQSDGTYSAALSARINPHGYETTCAAQYVSDAQFRESVESGEDGYAAAAALPCAPENLGKGLNAVTASALVSGLPPGARYHFRFLAANSQNAPGKETEGSDRTFLTFAVESFFFGPSRLQEQPYELLPPEPEDLQAGGHPYELNESFRLSTTLENPWGHLYPGYAVVNPRDIVTALPPGLIGNPQATPRCAEQELIHATCSGAAQVGVLRVEGNRQQSPNPPHQLPLYNLVPPAGVAAQLGAPLPKPVQASAHVDAGLDAGSGYAVNAAALNATAAEGLISVTATIWGVPHDPSHDGERFCPRPESNETTADHGGQCPSDAELESDLEPFLRNPTSCAPPARAGIEVDAWQGPGDAVGATLPYPQMEGCEKVPFAPEIALRPTGAAADSPTGLHVDLHVPQDETCDPGPPVSCGIGEADLRKAVVSLPEGLDVNPAGADGLAGCAPAQVELRGGEPARCPDASKIGTVEVETPLLDHPLRGGVYVATPHANPFRSLLAIYIAVDDPRTGVAVKLAGEVEADPATGRLTTTFDESPQLPFEDFRLDFFDGPRAALKTPATCGRFATRVELTPWSAPEGEIATPPTSFEVTSGPGGAACAGSAPHSPGFSAGTLMPRAGAYSPFVLRLTRGGASQQIGGLSATLPPGLTGRLAGVRYCPEEQLVAAAARAGRREEAQPSCPAASRVGTVTVAAGAGPSPLQVQGRAYLAGPHGGAPLSLAIVTPAVAGPFDLGTVVVRTDLYVDPQTAQIRAVSAPIPRMLEGIPLDIRSIAVKMDRPDFTLNPTSCEPMAIAATALSTLGRAAPLSNRFQVGGCDALPFAPRLALSLTGPSKRAGHPALKAVLRAAPGEANIAAAQVTLPRSQLLDQGHLQDICTKVQFNEGGGNGEGCPASSVYGFARAESPLLDDPVEGPVYLRASTHELPDLVAALDGQVDVVLAGRVDAVHGRIRNTFEVVPDAPVSSFTLQMQGGAKGLLVNSTNLCTHPKRNRAVVDFYGQNGKLSHREPVLQASCKKKRKKKRRT